MTDMLTIKISQRTRGSRAAVLHLTGRLNAETEAQLMEAARQAFDTGSRHLLLDLTGIDLITSAGLRGFQNIYKLFTPQNEIEAHRQDGVPYKSPYFKLACPSSQIYYIIELAGFLQNIPLYNNLQDAVASFS